MKGKQFFQSVADLFQGSAKLQHYRVYLYSFDQVTLGVRDNQLGGVYTPPQIAIGRGGHGVVQFVDGKIGRIQLNSFSQDRFEEILQGAWESRYEDNKEVCSLEEAVPGDAEILDPEVDRHLEGDLSYMVEETVAVLGRAVNYQVGHTSSTARVSKTESAVFSSGGLDMEQTSSLYSFSFSLDGMVSEGKSHRLPWEMEELSDQVEGAMTLHSVLRGSLEPPAGGTYLVLFHPSLLARLIEHFIIKNIYAGKIRTGQSAFAMREFQQQERRFRSDLTLGANPTRSYHPGSLHFSSAGIPAKKETFIKEGRLVQPVVSHKYSKLISFPLTYPPTKENLVFTGPPIHPYRETMTRMKPGLVAYSVLGLHTQDPVSGNFSLRAPSSLWVDDGEPQGKVSAVLDGNFFDLLQSPNMELVEFPHRDLPGLLVPCHCTFNRSGDG